MGKLYNLITTFILIKIFQIDNDKNLLKQQQKKVIYKLIIKSKINNKVRIRRKKAVRTFKEIRK